MKAFITNLIHNKRMCQVSALAKDVGIEEISLVTTDQLDKDVVQSILLEQFSVVGPKDLVVVQLPISQSKDYEKQLFHLLKDKQAHIACFIQEWDEAYEKFYSQLDSLILSEGNDTERENTIFLKQNSDFYIKKALLETVDRFVVNKASEDIVHIAFGLHDKKGDYSVWVGITMQSILDHTNSTICFHILHDDTLSDANKKKLIHIAQAASSFVQFHKIDIQAFDQIASQVEGYTIGSVFRILIPDLLQDRSKVLYLDADLFVNVDVKELWDTDLHTYCLGAVQDMNVINHRVVPLPVSLSELNFDEYFNSGVLLMNLIEIRKFGDMKDQIVNYLIEHTQSDLPDQDALNVVYSGKVKFLDKKYNCFVGNVRASHELKLENKIYHYVGTKCVLYHLNEVDYFYLQTMIKTNWDIENVNERIKYSFGRIKDRIYQYEQIIKNSSMQNKIRIICAESFNVDRFYSVFGKMDTDIVINDLKALESTIIRCKNESDFYCILSAGMNGLIEYMENLGFKNEKDFFVMQRFLSNLKGGFL